MAERLWGELKRRDVVRVGLLYGLASWLVLQVADVLFGIMGLPEWSLRLVFGILLLSLPVALVFAWLLLHPSSRLSSRIHAPWRCCLSSTCRAMPTTSTSPTASPRNCSTCWRRSTACGWRRALPRFASRTRSETWLISPASCVSRTCWKAVALELEPGQPEASDLLATLLGYLDRHEEAIAVLRRALERDPLSAQLQVLLAYQYIGSNRLAEAASHIERAASMAPRDLWAAQALSYLRYSQGRIGEAIAARTRVLLIDPRDYLRPLTMAQYYLELGMTEAALPWLEAAGRMAPEADDPRLYRALWHLVPREPQPLASVH